MSSSQIQNHSVRNDLNLDNLNMKNAISHAKGVTNVQNSTQFGKSGTAGTVTLYPATAMAGKTVISATNNSGDYDLTLTNAALGGARTYTMPDAYADADFVLSKGAYRTQANLFDDFLGTWAIGDAGPADQWSSTAGSGTGNQVATTVANSICGEITMESASDDGAHAANATSLTGVNLGWKASQGGLMMEARLKIDDISDAALFVGFTDTISTTVELPIFLNGADLDSDATNACGVGYDTDGTTEQFFHGGVAADVDTVPAYSGSAPVNDTYFIVRVAVSSAGAVTGYINGTPIGDAVASAITASTAVTPCIVVANRGAAQRIVTIDYIHVQQNR